MIAGGDKLFTLKLNMPIEKYQADKINRVFDTSIIIFNKLVRLKLKEFKELKKTTKYRELYNNKKWSELNKLQVASGFGKW